MKSSIFLSMGCLLFVLFLTQCGEPEEPIRSVGISQDFVLENKWKFDFISGDGVIFHIPRQDEDSNPQGFVEFKPDGTGFADFKTTLLGLVYSKTDAFTWDRITQDSVILTQIDDKVDRWSIIRATKDSLEADWFISIDGNTATLTAKLSKE